MDELAAWRQERRHRIDEKIRAAGLLPPARLRRELTITQDPAVPDNEIRFVAPDGTWAATVTFTPGMRVRFIG